MEGYHLPYASSDGEEDSPGQFETTVTFVEDGNKTHISMRMLFNTPEERDFVVREYGAIEGGKQTLARLAAFVEAL